MVSGFFFNPPTIKRLFEEGSADHCGEEVEGHGAVQGLFEVVALYLVGRVIFPVPPRIDFPVGLLEHLKLVVASGTGKTTRPTR